jgi:ribonuclease E
MSDRLLGEASAAGRTAAGSNGASGLTEGFQGNGRDAANEAGRGEPADASGQLTEAAASDELAEAGAAGELAEAGAAGEDGLGGTGKPRRRRRGSRGGRGRRSGALGEATGVGSPPEVPRAPQEGSMGALLSPGATGAGEQVVSPAPSPTAPAPGTGDGLSGATPPAVAAGPTSPGGPGLPGEVRKPKIGDTRPGSPPLPRRRPRREVGASGSARALGNGSQPVAPVPSDDANEGPVGSRPARSRRRRPAPGEEPGLEPGAAEGRGGPAQGLPEGSGAGAERSSSQRADVSRRRADRRLRPLGRYLMVVHVGPTATQIAVLEGRTLIEHYVSRPADDTTQIDGNIYLGRVQNVLPGMEAAFVDIGTPKNAVLYRGDLRYDEDEVAPAGEDDPKPTRGHLPGAAREARIEQLLHTGQNIICQVTKNPIGTKGARLTQEVSLPGRFVVLIPDSDTYGISKRLPDEERRRLRKILDDVRPEGHGLIVRTAAEGANAEELARDVSRLLGLWEKVQSAARTSRAPQLLYREPDLAVRVIREEFNREYRGVVVDDPKLYAEVKEYVTDISPELADRVELVDPAEEPLPLFERFRVHEQVHKALDRKVWLPSGGSIIIERTEALTVIDVNTGKNVGTSNLEETVFRNNLEAAEEIARQLRLRDIGGIIVIDFIDMEVPANRAEVMRTFREALARDKTRTQVFDISELGLVEMTRKRVSEGLVESYSETCPTCGGRGIVFDESLLG